MGGGGGASEHFFSEFSFEQSFRHLYLCRKGRVVVFWALCSEVFCQQLFRGELKLWASTQKTPSLIVKGELWKLIFELFDNFLCLTDFVLDLNQRVHHSSLLAETNDEFVHLGDFDVRMFVA